MKKLLLLSCVILGAMQPLTAQRSFEMGISGGITNYFGDLGNDPWIQPTSTQPGAAITFRNFLGSGGFSGNFYRPLSMEVRFSWNRLQYDEAKPIGGRKGFDLRNYGRGIGFRNDLFGTSVHMTYTFYANPRIPLYKQGPAFFVFTGIGAYYGQPKADLFRGTPSLDSRYFFWPDGTVRDVAYEGPQTNGNVIDKDGEYETNLADWYTEGSGYKGEGKSKNAYNFVNIAVPMGVGFRYGITKKITISTELGYYLFFTDFLDDVSSEYPTYAEINANFPNDPVKQALALYVSDPTGYGNSGYPGPATSRRGNPGKKDAYSYLNVEVAYKFDFRKGIPRLWGAR